MPADIGSAFRPINLKSSPALPSDYSVGSYTKGMSVDDFIAKLRASGSNTDIAFMVYQAQIKALNNKVTEALTNVQTTGRLRDAYSKKLTAWRDLQGLAKQQRGGENETITKDMLREQFTANKRAAGDKRTQAELNIEFDAMIDTALGEPRVVDGNVVMQRDSKQTFASQALSNFQTQIDKIKDGVRKFDSDREMQMIMLNTWMNKKSNAVSQLSSLMKAQHETAKSVINRLG